nr:prosaposin-like [Ipomoea batatas]
MDRRLCFVVLVLLAISCCCTAKDLAAAHLMRDVSEKQVQLSGDEDQCSECKEFIVIYSDKQKQAELIDDCHNYCFQILAFCKQCIAMRDIVLSAFFKTISSSTPETLCQWYGKCERLVPISEYASNSSCDLCHRAVMEAIHHLKNSDTQVEVLQLLLKACDSAKNFSTKCKKLVFKYACPFDSGERRSSSSQ